MFRKLILAALLLASCGRSESPPDLRITEAWGRETVRGQRSAAAYLTITNQGGGEDRLIGVAAPAPLRASLHETSRSGGIARMRPVAGGLVIRPGATVSLEPGGPHVMITNLQEPLEQGQSLALALRFEGSGERWVDVQVTGAAAAGPAHPGN